MAHAAVQPAQSVYEPSLFGTYSKKIGMWLFILSDSLTFGALLFAYSYGRISNPDWPTPFHSESIINATIMTAVLLSSSLTMVLAVSAASRGLKKATRGWMLATMAFGVTFVVLHLKEWMGLIHEGMLPNHNPWGPPQFGGTFFTLTGLHMTHVALGVIYLAVVATRWGAMAVIAVAAVISWLVLGPAVAAIFIVFGLITFIILMGLRKHEFTPNDVEVSGLYWHFVDLVWMFIFPLVYLMSTKIL